VERFHAFKAKMAEASAERWNDSEYRDKMTQASKARSKDPTTKAIFVQASKDRWKDTDARANMTSKISTTLKERHKDPAFHAKIYDPEVKAKISETVKAISQKLEVKVTTK
jgi:hypothetical protein